ncbi:MAG: type II toxin-antitoxin system prevent-host-death family antitoxin [Candidatus Pacebacteria bacterium CG10_big_fil_rev_8_21_14_0_10_56_10]|nr:MAG: type II toxin-antitoxin system prevent-host-death family antitoxin [Candidatus Pacebacteria bacterium CG10_big_fil_rev_8_21_14_0_10_56_10]
MHTVTIHDAKTNLSKYIAAVKKGKQVFIGGFGKPEVKLVQVTPVDLAASKTRSFSFAHHKIKEHSDSFSDQTEAIISDLLLGK